MNQMIKILFLFIVVFCLLPLLSVAQSGSTLYVQLDYMKVKPGEGGQYVQLEREIWKPIHSYRLDSGTMAGWSLWGLVMPGGSAVNYNYKTVDYYHSLGDLAEPLTLEIISNVHPDLTGDELDAFFERTINARSVYRSVLLQLIDYATATGE
jgi:hypothetical protein